MSSLFEVRADTPGKVNREQRWQELLCRHPPLGSIGFSSRVLEGAPEPTPTEAAKVNAVRVFRFVRNAIQLLRQTASEDPNDIPIADRALVEILPSANAVLAELWGGLFEEPFECLSDG